MNRLACLLAGVAALTDLPGAARADSFHVSIENAGVKHSTATFDTVGVEAFDTIGLGTNKSFSTDFGSGGVITGNYAGIDILAADQYGGAGGLGNYASTSSVAGYSLNLSTTNASGINYFGFWLSALDNGNTLTFSKAGATVFTFSPNDVLALVGSMPAYFGNPDGSFAGQNGSQAYAFLNFFDTDGTFDKVTFSENPTVGGYESDNHTVGFFTAEGGTPVGGVPEPATWAMMLMGFGGLGYTLRRRPVRSGSVALA